MHSYSLRFYSPFQNSNLYLEKLELQGFKTFVRKTTLTFPQPRGGERRGVAAIVGPNGSGKSNFADAIRWVMGEQSLKSIRGKKSEDVIFSGTEKLARVGLAEVSLYLNNEDKQAPIDFSQVVVTRRLYRSGESEYLINRHRVRLQDVVMLLAQASFGQKTYSIIGQGMVDAILMASPLERKAYFDEASGTRPLQLKQEEAESKLKLAEDNLRQGEALIQEIAPRLRSLTRQVKRLEKREEVARELAVLQQRYYGAARHDNAEALRRCEKALVEARTAREQSAESLASLESAFSKLEQAATSGDHFQELEKKRQELWATRTAVNEKLVAAKSALVTEAGKIKPGELSREVLAAVYYDLETSVAALVTAVEQSSEEAHSLLRELAPRLQSHIANFKQHVFGEQATNQRQQALTQDVAKLEAEASTLAAALDAAEEQTRQLHVEEQQKNKEIFALERDIRAARNTVAGLVAKENEHQIVLARLTTTRESLDREITEELDGAEPALDRTVYSEPEKTDMRQRMEQLKRRLAEIGTIDEETAREYEETKTRYEFLTREAEDLRRAGSDLKKVIAELRETIDRQFRESFQRISVDFERFFKILFSGGTAKLVQVGVPGRTVDGAVATTEEDVAENGSSSPHDRVGIDIQATPPGKRLKNISMLSGGERALTSLALICGIISSNPSPFVVLDEVDAALDEANSVRFAEIIDQLSHQTQFIVITHNRATMHQANILYGITMGEDGASKVLSLQLEDIEKT